MLKLTASCLLVGALVAGCSEGNSSKTVGKNPVPSLAGIAKATLPASLESSAVGLLGSDFESYFIDSNITEMKSRLFSPGPTDFLYRLKMVDSRLDEIGTRISDCASSTTQTATPPTIVTGFSFPMKLSCMVTIDAASQGVSTFKVYFGKDAGYWYLVEVQENAGYSTGDAEPPSMAVLSKVSEDGNEMDVWQISVERKTGTDYAGVMHITANKTTGVFSLVTASSADSSQTISPGANFSGLGCGVRMITDGTEVYADGSFSQNSSCPTSAQICTDSALETKTGCTTLSASSSFLTLFSRGAVSGAQAKSLIIDRTWLPTL